MTPIRLAFVGTGPVARALSSAWAESGGVVVAVLSRDVGRATAVAAQCGARPCTDASGLLGADVVVVCVPDRAIADVGHRVAAALGGAAEPPRLVVHTSGALTGAELLRNLPGARLSVASLHPLQSFSSTLSTHGQSTHGQSTHGQAPHSAADRLAGVHWFHEGSGAAACRSMVGRWRGTFHPLAPDGKALYHAGAAVLSNHTVALFADATRLFEAAGVPAADARPALAALLAGTAANLANVGVPAALTGPVARGDIATVRGHVAALAGSAPDLLDAYRAMARRAVVVALEKGSIDAPTAAALLAELADPRGAGAPAR